MRLYRKEAFPRLKSFGVSDRQLTATFNMPYIESYEAMNTFSIVWDFESKMSITEDILDFGWPELRTSDGRRERHNGINLFDISHIIRSVDHIRYEFFFPFSRFPSFSNRISFKCWNRLDVWADNQKNKALVWSVGPVMHRIRINESKWTSEQRLQHSWHRSNW